jgi:hypothetical protein
MKIPRVLVVEDEKAIAELISVNLRHHGMLAVLAEDGEAAQAAIDDVLPDVILLDWMLPGQSGLAGALHSDAVCGHALYTDETLGSVMSLLMVFSGVGVMGIDGLDAEGAGRSVALQGQGCFELPAFLQKSQSQESRQ